MKAMPQLRVPRVGFSAAVRQATGPKHVPAGRGTLGAHRVLGALAAAAMALALWELAPAAADGRGASDANADANAGGGGRAAPREKVRILLISGGAGREFQYLRNCLLRQEDEYLLSTWQQNADPNVNQSSSSPGMRPTAMPRTAEALVGVPGDANLPGYQVVILYDPQHVEGSFDKVFVEDALKPFVERHGGGLCYIAGRKYTETVLMLRPDLAPLRDMLPVKVMPNTLPLSTSRPAGDPPVAWPLKLIAEANDHSITMLGRTREESNSIWGVLPGVYWSQAVLEVKKGASVLAVFPDPAARLANSTEPLPVLAVRPWGRGKVLYVGCDETWRWVSVQEGACHRAFWGNVIRHLAEATPPRTENEGAPRPPGP